MTKGLSERLRELSNYLADGMFEDNEADALTCLEASDLIDRLTVDGLAGVVSKATPGVLISEAKIKAIAQALISYITAPSGELSEKGLGALPGTFIERQCADAQERSPRSAESLPDDELVAAFQQACRDWDALTASLEEDGGRGGSPMEGLGERLDGLETALKRRGFDPDRLVPSDSGQVKS